MTATVPRQGPPEVGGPRPADRRYGAVYAYDVADHHTGVVHEGDYVGQSRVPELRDRQHRGLAPQRDGTVREQPWADLIVGPMRILEAGMFTDAELNQAEIRWMVRCRSRLNFRDNPNPVKIPIPVQQRERDARDIAAGLAPRDWSRPAPRTVDPTGHVLPHSTGWARFWASPVGRWTAARLRQAARVVLPWAVGIPTVWAALWLVAALALHQPAREAAANVTAALIVAAVGYGIILARKTTRPRRRNSRTNQRR